MSVRLYIGNLPKEEVDRQELQAVFADAGDSVTTKVIKDRKTGKCRGFGFVTVNDDEQADQIIEKFNGHMFRDTPLKIEKALPRSKSQQEEEEQSSSNASDNNQNESYTEKNNNKRSGGGNKKFRRPANSNNNNNNANNPETIQPDPRWANELEKLKQMLAAQASNG